MEIKVVFFKADSPEWMKKPDHKLNPITFSVGHLQKDLPNEGEHTLILDDKFLFANQINTENYRIFDNVVYRSFANNKILGGHWIKWESLKRIEALRTLRHVCRYCRFQTNEPETYRYYCPNCPSSPFLKRKFLYLTRLIPVICDSLAHANDPSCKDIDNDKVPAFVVDRYSHAQYLQLQEEKEKYLQRERKEIEEIKRKMEVMRTLFDLGIRPRDYDVYYYGRTDELVFTRVEDEDMQFIKDRMKEFTLCKWKIKRR